LSLYFRKVFFYLTTARERFKEFNERRNDDKCLNDRDGKGLSDEEARMEIKRILGGLEIAQVKSLPKLERKEVLKKVKGIEGVSMRQASRIVGVSVTLIFKA